MSIKEFKIDNHGFINLVAVDPGTNYTGVAILKVSLPDLKIIGIETILLDMFGMENRNVLGTDLQKRLEYVNHNFIKVLNYYKPYSVTIESPFINRFRPQAVIPLANLLWSLESASMMHNKYMIVNRFAPSTIKNKVGAKGGADKIGVLDAVLKMNEITSLINPLKLSEHEVDGIAIAYTQLCLLRENGWLLLT